MSAYRNAIRVGIRWRLSDFEDRITHEVIVDQRLVTALDTLRANLGHDFTIVAGYVAPGQLPHTPCRYPTSHFLGEAVDVVIVADLKHLLMTRAMEIPDLVVHEELTHVHLDVRHGTHPLP